MNNFLNNFINLNDELTITMIMVGLSISFIHGFIISKIYLKTYSGFSFDKTFSFTLILLTVIVSLVMMVISTNIALSLGLLGSLSIIRFRTVIKDSRDMAFLFWAIAMGLTVGAKYFYLSFIIVLIIAVIIILVEKFNINKIKNTDFILIVNHDSLNKDVGNKVEEILNKYDLKFNVKSSYSDIKNKNFEITYNITLKDDKNIITNAESAIADIQSVNNVSLLGPESNIYA